MTLALPPRGCGAGWLAQKAGAGLGPRAVERALAARERRPAADTPAVDGGVNSQNISTVVNVTVAAS